MYHPSNHMPRPSAPLTAASVFGPILGELPELIRQWMDLPEHVKAVQVDTQVMFHWAKSRHPLHNLRGDTGTYQWVAKAARDVLSNPCALRAGNRERTYQIIGQVEPPGPLYSSIRYFRLVLKYVPSTQAASGSPEMWLVTYNPHSDETIRPYLQGAFRPAGFS
jgi:hypothetical protein